MFLFLFWSCQPENPPLQTEEQVEKKIEVSPRVTTHTTDPGPLRIFTLNDGSIISGYLISTNPEGFVIKSETLGVITVPTQKVQSMDLATNNDKKNASPAPRTQQPQQPQQQSSNNGIPTLSNVEKNQDQYTQSKSETIEFSNTVQKQAVSQLRDQMMQDPDILYSLYQLQNDPDFMKIAQDPEILQLIQKGDFEALSQHPKIKKLEKSPALRSIFKSLE